MPQRYDDIVSTISTLKTLSHLDEDSCEPLIISVHPEWECDNGLEAVKPHQAPFSWTEYCCFFVIGLSMMWTWSMILQAVPYFQRRFREDPWILRYFQAFYLVVFAITMSTVTIVLTAKDGKNSYTSRLRGSLMAYVAVASMLMLSTIGRFHLDARQYFPFTLGMVVVTAVANAMSQNAAFAFAAGFGRTEYAPAIMTGEAVAGLLPSTIEIISAIVFPASYSELNSSASSQQTSTLTLGYFLSAALVGLTSLHALKLLKHRSCVPVGGTKELKYSQWNRLSKTLKWPALANFSCLCISSVTPVFVGKITSVVPGTDVPLLLRPDAFIPIAIVLWNLGDLIGSILSVSSHFLIRFPFALFILSLARACFIPLYLMCNIDGRGSLAGDWFYLVIVQFGFGISHGWLSGSSMMGVPKWVAEEDCEEAGAFMGMTLVAGLVAGSMLGLLAAKA